jgi:hypothetical protein
MDRGADYGLLKRSMARSPRLCGSQSGQFYGWGDHVRDRKISRLKNESGLRSRIKALLAKNAVTYSGRVRLTAMIGPVYIVPHPRMAWLTGPAGLVSPARRFILTATRPDQPPFFLPGLPSCCWSSRMSAKLPALRLDLDRQLYIFSSILILILFSIYLSLMLRLKTYGFYLLLWMSILMLISCPGSL